MNYITTYLRATANTKPAVEYHIWCMLSTLSVFAGKRFWLPFGPRNYYTHLYVVLVGDPGIAKSSAMDFGKDVVRAAAICPISATQVTKQALSQAMSGTIDGLPRKTPYAGQRFFDHAGRKIEYNQFAIFATEIVEFLGKEPTELLSCLTNLWTESVWDIDTKNKGKDFCVGPYVTLLGCMTPETMKSYIKLNFLTGGFARRCAFMYCAHDNFVPWPEYTQEQAQAEEYCVAFGKWIQKRSGPFTLSPECKALYIDWATENERTRMDHPVKIKSWFSSKGEMLFKLAMLIALGEMGMEEHPLVIEAGHYRLAMKYCAMLEATLERVYEGTGINPNAGVIAQVCRMLEGLDRPMNYKHLLAMFAEGATSINELKDVIGHLVQVERLAQKDIYVNGIQLGTVIGTPRALGRYTLVQLATFLPRQVTDSQMVSLEESPEDVASRASTPVLSPISLPTDSPVVTRQVVQPAVVRVKADVNGRLVPEQFVLPKPDVQQEKVLETEIDPEDQSQEPD